MANNTLYDAQRLLIFLITFYGFNESKAILKVYNAIARLFAFSLLFLMALLIVGFTISDGKEDFLKLIGKEVRKAWLYLRLYIGANISCFLLCQFRKRHFNALLPLLKRYRLPQKVSRKIRQWNIFLAFFVFPAFCIWQIYSVEGFESALEIAFNLGVKLLTNLLVYCLPLCSLPVLVSILYINRTVNERVEEIEKCKSPLRRARLTTRLILLSTRLNPLVKATNDYGAPLMLLLKVTASMMIVFNINEALASSAIKSFDTHFANFMKSIPPSSFILIYLLLLRVAPSANQIPSLISRVMVENVMRDEQGMSREPTSSIQLLKTRWVQLAHLTHSPFNQEQFTVLGEPVDEADIFMVFVEVVDNFNTINSVLW